MTNLLTVAYLTCFAACTWPGIIRVWRRRSSADLSIWREWLILLGVVLQYGVMHATGAAWQVAVSPILSGVGVLVMLVSIWWWRSDHKGV